MPKKSNASIPLLCSLCPKHPQFSDVPHLLTHISSKSHLANRFKLQIRSHTDSEARGLLTEFDDWYRDNGLDDLLSERLAAKEQKKTTKRTRTTLAAASMDSSGFGVDARTSSVDSYHSQTNADTRLGIKANSELEQQLAAIPLYKASVPRMYTWSTDPNPHTFATPLPMSPWDQHITYETPTMKRSPPNISNGQSLACSSMDLM